EYAADVGDYRSLYRWSITSPDRFWPAVWRFCGVIAAEQTGREPWEAVGVGLDRMAPPDPAKGPRWFPGARLNFAEDLLRRRVAAALEAAGVRPGDRVAAFMPNVPETVIAMLAATSLGAVWSSCSPDFGVAGVVDRFGQIAPRILFCADGYRYASKEIDCLERVAGVAARIPAIERLVVVPYLRKQPPIQGIPGGVLWDEWVGPA